MNKTDTKEYYAEKSKEWRSRNPLKVKLSNEKTKSKIPSCHPDRRHKAMGLCEGCYKRHRMKTDPVYAEKVRIYDKKRSEKRRKDPKYKMNLRNRMLKSNYNIDLNDYDKLLEKQDNKCAICEQRRITKKNKNLHVDHDHSTGEIRGLLCIKCNLYMGEIDKNINVLYNLIKYKGINL